MDVSRLTPETMTPADWQEFEALRAEYSRRKLLGFTAYCNANYQPSWHHHRVAAELDAVLDGRTKRLMLFMPPQNGKTELASRNMVAMALGKDPDLQVVFGTYNADRAKEVSGEVQAIMESAEYRALFHGTRLAGSKDDEVRNARRFEVVGRKGVYQAAGVGQGITGKSMMLGIIDDPIKGREEAESEAIRRQVKNWWKADFSTRQMTDQCAIVVIQTRWHTDDLAGWLLKIARENPTVDMLQWRVVSFPAILERETPGDPRRVGEALWPTRFSKKWLEAERILKGSYDWAALYQQTPIPPGGAMAKREWFRVSAGSRAPVRRRCRCWDLAATEETAGRDPDWTVGAKLAWHTDDTVTIEDIKRVRTTPAAVDALMKQTAHLDGRDCLIREWQDPGAAGKSVISSHLKMLHGFDYEALPSSGEKSLRWRPFLVQAEGGNVYYNAGQPWNNEFLDEMETVPYGLHDDIADGCAGAYQTLAEAKDKGPSAAVVMPGGASRTVSGPPLNQWQEQYFRR